MARKKDETSALPLIALFLIGPILVAGIFLATRESNQVTNLKTRVAALSTEIATLQPTAPTATPSPAAPTLIVITGAALQWL